jgi:hypothetical protein
MKKHLVLFAAAAAVTAFVPIASHAQVSVEVPGAGVRVGEPPRHEERVIREEHRDGPGVEMREREVRGRTGCDSKTVHESGPGGSETRTKTRCD